MLDLCFMHVSAFGCVSVMIQRWWIQDYKCVCVLSDGVVDHGAIRSIIQMNNSADARL